MISTGAHCGIDQGWGVGMWWEQRSEAGSSLATEANRLHALYKDRLQSPSDRWVIRGVGAGPTLVSTPGEQPRTASLAQEWHPLILIDDRSVGAQQTLSARFSYLELDTGSLAAQVLGNWQLRADTLVEPVGPLVPAISPGDTYNGSGQATVGLPVTMSGSSPGSNPGAPGFLTVAHGVGVVGSAVTISASGGSVPAHVSFRDESARGLTGGDDIAVVVLDPPNVLSGWLVNQGTQPAPAGPPYAQQAVDLFGGMSGSILAQVSGALLQMGDQMAGENLAKV
jgi:hypothetical protein